MLCTIKEKDLITVERMQREVDGEGDETKSSTPSSAQKRATTKRSNSLCFPVNVHCRRQTMIKQAQQVHPPAAVAARSIVRHNKSFNIVDRNVI